jgi:hypothetical protein
LLADESQTNGAYYTASTQDRQALCILVTSQSATRCGQDGARQVAIAEI